MMTRRYRSWSPVLGGLAGLALAAASPAAHAQQVDTNPPPPNVLLLIDNSGSMERLIDGNPPESEGFSCNCTDNGIGKAPTCTGAGWTTTSPAAPTTTNRWNTLQTALTGSISGGFNCISMNRASGTTFENTYKINGVPAPSPYDLNYELPFHRLVAQDTSTSPPQACVVGPGGLPGWPSGTAYGPSGKGLGGSADLFPWPSGSLVAAAYGTGASCTQTSQGSMPGFPQFGDGAITSMSSLMRFGVMTFDNDPSSATGTTGTAGSLSVNTTDVFTGMWTYGPSYTGQPPNCVNPPTLMAVGGRNTGAPPWEGRMVQFPSAYDSTTQTNLNTEVSNVVLAARPYGATPIAGMMKEAQYYFWTDPNGPQQIDSFVKGGCRNEYIILVTDGAPNMDMELTESGQASCSAGGVCPFPLPQDTAKTLYNNGSSTANGASVKTYVLGFAVSNFKNNNVACSTFAAQTNNNCDCTSHTLAAQSPGGPCCVLECIARNGGSTNAYFADTPGDLTNALDAILSDIAKNATTRTTPAYSPVITNVLSSQTTPQTNQSLFLASFNPVPGRLWTGNVQRQRSQCTWQNGAYSVPTPSVQSGSGDDFAVNLATGSPARTFIEYAPAAQSNGTANDPSGTIRPYATATPGDSVGQLDVTEYVGAGSSLDGQLPLTTMGVPAATACTYSSSVNGTPQSLTAAECAQMLLDYTYAQPKFANAKGDFTFIPRTGVQMFGGVYHATPVVVGPPGSLLQDPGYQAFAATEAGWGARKQVVYVATTDGLLHAFWADETKAENNELWAMLLPGAMPNLRYPSNLTPILDGPLVVKDMVWSRNVADASNGVGTDWHTMLVASFGQSQTGYYAVDVTNPDPSGMKASLKNPPDDGSSSLAGPVFRWQLTKMPGTNMPLFGAHAGTPALTTLFLKDPNDSVAKEIGVAILPGGRDDVTTTASCPRLVPKTSDSAPDGAYAWRDNVRCWGNPGKDSNGNVIPQSTGDFVRGRSVTIVRVDTGEILRVFARKTDMNLTAYASDTIKAANRFTNVDFDSPITGTPIVFPNDTGSDTTKFFIGDEDGTIWRFDVSDKDPANWSADLFLDLYNKDVNGTATTNWNDGQPFHVNPELTLDPAGNIVINAAAGSTTQYDTTGTYYVYSITEKVTGTTNPKFRANVNWWMQPGVLTSSPGERVSGPMTVFNGTLYFSTFAAAAATSTNVCNLGTARLWGRDFEIPKDTQCTSSPSTCDRSLGGTWELASGGSTPSYVNPGISAVIPGVSIKATPACAGLSTATGDQYIAGANHSSTQNFAAGSYSLFSQVGAPGGANGATQTINMAVPTPISPTTIDSWAAVLE